MNLNLTRLAFKKLRGSGFVALLLCNHINYILVPVLFVHSTVVYYYNILCKIYLAIFYVLQFFHYPSVTLSKFKLQRRKQYFRYHKITVTILQTVLGISEKLTKKKIIAPFESNAKMANMCFHSIGLFDHYYAPISC